MRTNDLQTQLINYTVANSGHQDRRLYIGLSGIADCDQVIYDRYIQGQAYRIDDHLRSKISYELESAVIARLADLGVYGPGENISLYHGLVQGHTDGVIDGRDLLEIKTISREQYFPESRVPRRVFWQVQAYLHFTRREWAHIVYLARDTGYIKVYPLRYKPGVGERISEKVLHLVNAVRDLARPECSCGRCNSGGAL